MNAPERSTLNLSRSIRAPRENVFDAFATEAGISEWMSPRGMQIRSAQADAVVGGIWRVEMQSRDGNLFVAGGQYRELQRPSRLIYTWMWEGEHSPMPNVETQVEVSLRETDGGTELHMAHSGFPTAAARDAHGQGWISSLNRLNDMLDPQGSAGTITLLGDARSTYTRAARMALAEKAVAYKMQSCAPHSPELLAVHPFGLMPALLDGEIEIWETAAIVSYLDECFATGVSLRPGSIMERTRCTQWISAINGYLYDTMIRRYVLQIFFPKGEGGKPDHGVIDGALTEMPRQLAALEKAYGANDFLAGSSLSGADLFLAPILAYVQFMPAGGQLMANYPNVMRAQNLIRQRASFSSTNPQS